MLRSEPGMSALGTATAELMLQASAATVRPPFAIQAVSVVAGSPILVLTFPVIVMANSLLLITQLLLRILLRCFPSIVPHEAALPLEQKPLEHEVRTSNSPHHAEHTAMRLRHCHVYART